MAKETMIVFVYDTMVMQDEPDDPVNAVLYFHPSWVSDTQKVALCGQLMGTAHFLKDCFGKPRVLALENGKFVLREFGRFIVAVGTDRNIPDYLLEYRADLLSSLLRLFHCDLQTVYDQINASVATTAATVTGTTNTAPQKSRKNVSERFYHIFETYLPMLQHKGNIFHNELRLRMPKTGGNLFLEAIQTLQECQQTKGILGGAILYHNKVLATQLDTSITKQLVLSDPLHVRTTAEYLHAVDFHIPNGVQMIVVYVKASLYRELVADSQRVQSLPLQQPQVPLPNFQVAKRKMKRDPSLIFTNIPEEEIASGSGGTCGEKTEQEGDCAEGSIKVEEQTTEDASTALSSVPIRPKSMLKRPNHLPLRSFKCPASAGGRDLPESGIASINFDESDSFPEFIGRTSVCSTPMTENKVLPVMRRLSICVDPDAEEEQASGAGTVRRPTGDAKQENRKSLRADVERFFSNFLTQTPQTVLLSPTTPLTGSAVSDGVLVGGGGSSDGSATRTGNELRRSSLADLQDSLRKLSKKLSLKRNTANEGAKIQKTERPRRILDSDDDEDPDEEDFIENDADKTEEESTNRGEDGEQLKTRALFHEFLDKYYKLWDAGVDGPRDEEIAELITQFKEFDSDLQELDASLKSRERKNGSAEALMAKPPQDKVPEERPSGSKDVHQPRPQTLALAAPTATSKTNKFQAKTPLEKRSLTLPLKPLAEAPTPLIEQLPTFAAAPLSTTTRRPMGAGGVPLTPLMAKLSVLAMCEERGGMTGWDGGCTPSAGVEIQTPLSVLRAPFPRRISLKCEDGIDALSTNLASGGASAGAASSKAGQGPGARDGEEKLQRLELYMCEQQNMTLLLLMEENCSRQQKIVQDLFDLCVATFPQMENTLTRLLSVNFGSAEGEKKRDNDYSYICLDTHWESVQRAGPWNPVELNTLDYMHRDLYAKHPTNERANLTDLIVRTADSVYYGRKWACTEYFYREPAAPPAAGVPPPSDPLATVPMRAKARLEKDHSYVIF